ncbi:hypothetical protein AX774_g6976 [Zancudomyces culisetae]|uniref:Uncharacterized protein n=1 Tax=Zancudomyces culisetae TaxID=1213189 RepID=A0A1R1PF47_ZANCU|nr:hypothetical protein AX774_g6976 [Zancudomyces culisetae]|eukprot:OMH79604.1 hypothetical protein AX774_g6976 [Zancudomyces culisetae]
MVSFSPQHFPFNYHISFVSNKVIHRLYYVSQIPVLWFCLCLLLTCHRFNLKFPASPHNRNHNAICLAFSYCDSALILARQFFSNSLIVSSSWPFASSSSTSRFFLRLVSSLTAGSACSVSNAIPGLIRDARLSKSTIIMSYMFFILSCWNPNLNAKSLNISSISSFDNGIWFGSLHDGYGASLNRNSPFPKSACPCFGLLTHDSFLRNDPTDPVGLNRFLASNMCKSESVDGA